MPTEFVFVRYFLYLCTDFESGARTKEQPTTKKAISKSSVLRHIYRCKQDEPRTTLTLEESKMFFLDPKRRQLAKHKTSFADGRAKIQKIYGMYKQRPYIPNKRKVNLKNRKL